MFTQSKLNICYLGFAIAFLSLLQFSSSEMAIDWQYWALRVAHNPLVIGIAIFIGLAINDFKVSLALLAFSLVVMSITFSFDSAFTWIIVFLTASFFVVTTVIALVNLIKNINFWILKIE